MVYKRGRYEVYEVFAPHDLEYCSHRVHWDGHFIEVGRIEKLEIYAKMKHGAQSLVEYRISTIHRPSQVHISNAILMLVDKRQGHMIVYAELK